MPVPRTFHSFPCNKIITQCAVQTIHCPTAHTSQSVRVGRNKKKTTMKTLHLVALHPEITPFCSLGFKWVYTSERFIRPRHGTAKQQQLTTAHLPPPTIIRRLERDGGGKSLTQTLRPPSHGDEMMDDFRDDATAGCSRRTPARIQSRICSEKWSKERQCRGIGDGADGCGRIA